MQNKRKRWFLTHCNHVLKRMSLWRPSSLQRIWTKRIAFGNTTIQKGCNQQRARYQYWLQAVTNRWHREAFWNFVSCFKAQTRIKGLRNMPKPEVQRVLKYVFLAVGLRLRTLASEVTRLFLWPGRHVLGVEAEFILRTYHDMLRTDKDLLENSSFRSSKMGVAGTVDKLCSRGIRWRGGWRMGLIARMGVLGDRMNELKKKLVTRAIPTPTVLEPTVLIAMNAKTTEIEDVEKEVG